MGPPVTIHDKAKTGEQEGSWVGAVHRFEANSIPGLSLGNCVDVTSCNRMWDGLGVAPQL